MNVLWFTRRTAGDLCATTQFALSHGLCERGHDLTIVNPDVEGSHQSYPWEHIGLPISAVKGLQGRTLGKKMQEFVKAQKIPRGTIAIVDWQVAAFVVPSLESKSIHWILMDRSPPADRGVLAWLQWPSWKRAWQMVERNANASGCVVSKAHQSFVMAKLKSSMSPPVILNAGADINLFCPKKKGEQLTLVYHGRLDTHRGVLALPMFAQKARAVGLSCRLIMIGEGDAFSGLERVSAGEEYFELYPSMEQSELAKILGSCHIGLLPMPERGMWKIASPLKRSEYAASGLLVLGIDHAGHRLEEQQQPKWMKLIQPQDFHDDGIEWLRSFTRTELESLSLEARIYAEEHMTWNSAIGALENLIRPSSF